MSTRTCSRVCAVGSEEDMLTLCHALLSNRGWLPEDAGNLSLEQLTALVKRHSQMEGGEECTFFYDMVAESPYGEAQASECRLDVRRHPSGVWTACFVYGGDTPFQPEDWLRFHRQCRCMPMLAMYADWDFGLEKGMKRFVGGKVGDDWSRMGETWLWLMAEYEFGFPPEEAVARLRKLRLTFDREDFDMTIGELLDACIENLQLLEEDTADPEALRSAMQACREAKDFTELLRLYLRIAETALWESQHVQRWIANLRAVKSAWTEAEGEDA